MKEIKYDSYSVSEDVFKHRPHIYYLLGNIKETGYCVATYSLKTKRLIVKCANELLPPEHILREFIDYCESKGESKWVD